MATVDDLPPDQRAALQLLLRQDRSYEEIADLLRIEPRAIRERARGALDALGPEEVAGLELEEQDDVADYLLGQQSASRRAATRELLEQSAPARAWARVVAGELRPLAGDNLPEIPSEAAEVDEAFGALQARSEHRERVQRSSKVGGAILLAGLGILIAGALALALGAFSGDDDSSSSGGTGTTAATTSTGTSTSPPIEAQINLTPPDGSQSKAAGVAQIARQDGNRAVALAIQGLQAANQNRFYAVWLYTSADRTSFQGFLNPQPGNDGRVATGFPLPKNANRFQELIVTRETQERPKTPGTIVLRGRLELPAG